MPSTQKDFCGKRVHTENTTVHCSDVWNKLIPSYFRHSAVPWMTLEYTKKGLGVGIKQFYLAFFPTSTYQTTIWSEISSICIFSETVQVLLNDLCDWIVYLDLAETSNERLFQRVRIRFRFMSTAMWRCDSGCMVPDIVAEYQDQFAHWKSTTTQKAWILNNTAVRISSLGYCILVL